MSRIDGGTGDDEALEGGLAADEIFAGSGADRLFGAGGADRLFGGEGDDRVFGGAGDDTIVGDDFGGGAFAITSTEIETGRDRLVFAAAAPGDDGPLYLVEQQSGEIHRFDPATGESGLFLDLPDEALSDGNEEGLLGLAFHPDYAANGRFFIHFVNAAGDVEVREFQRDADDPFAADADSGRTVIIVPHPDRSNHNGGTVAFGPDGMLYVSVGDGGGAGDPDENGQNPNTLLGSILRIDVDRDEFPGDPARNYGIPSDNPFASGGGAPEVWDFGLRNPFRFAFDPATGDLLIGDVGQRAREEIDLHPAGAPGGLNFGWNIREGSVPFAGGPTDGLTEPLFDYDRSIGVSVTGGDFAPLGGGLAGAYAFADFVTGAFFTLRVADGAAVDVVERSAQFAGDGVPPNVAAFVSAGDGAFYAASLGGSLFQLEFGDAAGAGDDRLRGAGGDDMIRGGAGEDSLFGGAGDDALRGGLGDDVLRGRADDDDLRGGGGDDDLRGGAGNDTLRGGRGEDEINGGTGDDILRGGVDADVFVFRRNAGEDVVRDYRDALDRVDLTAFALGDFSVVANALSAAGDGTRLDLAALGGAGSVLFQNVAVAAFDETDFLL